jgi:hypothetical protein
MTLLDLFFLASVLFVVILCGRIAVSAVRRRWETTRRSGRLLGLFLASYAAILVSVALLRPRRFYPPGERRCFDDWCATALAVEPAAHSAGVPSQADPGGRDWIATIEVSSAARRIRQRAPDARAELEDQRGNRYRPCAPPLARGTEPARLLSDEIGPGESFRVFLPYRLPDGAVPAGVVLHHGDFPGVAIIGADQSFLHPPALQRFPAGRPPSSQPEAR